MRPFKIWNCSRTARKTVVASSLQMLMEKGSEKLGIAKQNVIKVVLEEDGSEVDEEYFSFLPQNVVLQLLTVDERWESAEAAVNRDQPLAENDTNKETVSAKVKLQQRTLTSAVSLGPALSLCCETPNTEPLSVDTKQLKEQTQIYSLRDPTEKLYNYHKAINDAAYQIALQNPMLAGKEGDLNKLAVAKLESDGYNYCKKKSRSKQLNSDLDQSKRVKLQSDFRTKRVKEVSEELTEVDKQMQLCIKQRERYSNCQQYNSAIF